MPPAQSRRVVILTGAAGGIGRAMASALLAAGHAVAAVDIDGAALTHMAHECATAVAEGTLHTIAADVADEAACNDAVAAARAQFGRVDVLINNAGIGVSMLRADAEARHPTIGELTPEIWDRFFAVNVRAPMLLLRAALPVMREGGFGRIINNTTSYRTMLRVLPYGATKAALESMSAVWAEELAGTGITVNVLIPGGPTDTRFIGDQCGWPRAQMLRPAVMGPPACWLVSDAAGDITGQRVTAGRWNAALAPAEAAKYAMRPIGWPELAGDAVWLAAAG